MSDVWELIYWPFAGRGEFVRLMFEEAGVPYKENNDSTFIRQNINAGIFPGYPTFAVPVIKKGDFVLSQTPVITKYLGKQFGLYPDSEEDQWRADQVVTTIHDFVTEGRLVFHARGFVESYYTQKEETKGHIEWFERERFQKWMRSLERFLAYNQPNEFVVGNKITYVDLSLFQAVRAAEDSFPDCYKAQIDDFPLIKAHRERIQNRPRLQAYFKSERSRPLAGNSMM